MESEVKGKSLDSLPIHLLSDHHNSTSLCQRFKELKVLIAHDYVVLISYIPWYFHSSKSLFLLSKGYFNQILT